MGSDAAVWIALSAMIAACCCSFLMIVNSDDWAPEQAPPTRPGRRRLTKEQVRNMLPVYRFDGESLQLLPQRIPPSTSSDDGSSTEANDQTEGLVTGTLATEQPPRCSDLELCSICLDEYEYGDKLRVLPCRHAFHSRCVGKWLSERSAVCPLCKEDIYVEDDEESDDEAPAEIPRSNDDTFWSRFYQQIMATGQDDIALPDNTATPEAGLQATPSPNQEEPPQEFPRPSWWSRMFPTRQQRASHESSVETTRMLSEPLLLASEQHQEADEEAPVPPVEAQPVVQAAGDCLPTPPHHADVETDAQQAPDHHSTLVTV